MSTTGSDQSPVHVVVLARSETNLLSHWCDSTINDIHDIEPGYIWLRCRGILLWLGLLVHLMTLLWS